MVTSAISKICWLTTTRWAISYLMVNTSNWWGGHRVLVCAEWIKDVSWPESSVSVDLTRQAIKDAPRYESAASLDRQLEQAIHQHYGRPAYWTTGKSRRRSQDDVRHASPDVRRRRQA